MLGIASRLQESNPLKEILFASATIYFEKGHSSVASGNYEGEHCWQALQYLYCKHWMPLEQSNYYERFIKRNI